MQLIFNNLLHFTPVSNITKSSGRPCIMAQGMGTQKILLRATVYVYKPNKSKEKGTKYDFNENLSNTYNPLRLTKA